MVGSDQVWRPMYYPTKIENAYLDFARDWNVKRMAYAASFGTSDWEYTAGQTRRCRELLRKFDVVSVREESAVGLCRKFFGGECQPCVRSHYALGCPGLYRFSGKRECS